MINDAINGAIKKLGWDLGIADPSGRMAPDYVYAMVVFAESVLKYKEPTTFVPQSEVIAKFKLGQTVEKNGGAQWKGGVCGFYSTNLTPIGYAVESIAHRGSVQIYPESHLRLVEISR